MFGYVREEPIIHSISDTTRDIILYIIYIAALYFRICYLGTSARPVWAPCHQSWLWPTGSHTLVPWHPMAMGEDMGRYGKINIPYILDGSWWINMDQHSKIFQELGKLWESVDCWVYAVYIMHKYRVHIDTERERDRERERPGGKWDEWGWSIQHWAPTCTLCTGLIRFLRCKGCFWMLKKQITLLRVIPTMTFQNSLLTPLLSEAFVTGLLPN